MFCFNDDSYLFLCFLFINLLKMTSIGFHLASTFNSTLCMVLYLMSKWWIVCFKIVFEVVVHYEKDNLFIRFSNFPSISKFHIMKLKKLYAIFNTNFKSLLWLLNLFRFYTIRCPHLSKREYKSSLVHNIFILYFQTTT